MSEARLAALEERVAELEAEVAALRDTQPPVDQVRSMHEEFVERLREAKR